MTLKQRPAIRISSVSKKYRLGVTHARSLRDLAENALSLLSQKKKPSKPVASQNNARIDGQQIWALRDIDCEIKEGEVIGLIGKNGAGKSTLLKLVSRITYPTSGRIELYGRVACLLEVGTGFHPELTGRENIYLNGAILGMTRSEVSRKLDEIVDFSGVEDFLDTPVKRYSSGMTVRLGFAVAANLDPEILIVDEVLAVGDIEFQTRCIDKMRSVAETGRTVLFVSHNLSSIRALTKRAIVLSGGRIAFDGSTSDGIAHYVKDNLIVGRVSQDLRQAERTMPGLRRTLQFVSLALRYPEFDGTLPFGEPFTLDFDLYAAAANREFIVRLAIFTDARIPIGKSYSTALDPPAAGTIKSYSISANFPLGVGSYHCAISISNARDQGVVYDALTDVLPFRVSGTGITSGATYLSSSSDSGFVVLEPMGEVASLERHNDPLSLRSLK